MPTTTLSKGIVQGWSPGETGWGDFMNANLKRINALLNAQWAQDFDTTVGLTYGFRGGMFAAAGTPAALAGGTVALTASATNYVYRNGNVVEASATGFPLGSMPMAIVVTDVSNILSVTDCRLFSVVDGNGNLQVPNDIYLAQALLMLGAVNVIRCNGLLKIMDGSNSNELLTMDQDGNSEQMGNATVNGDFTAVGSALIAGTLQVIGGMNASDLKSGTVPAARLAGAYSGVTGLGTLASLAVTGRAYSGRVVLGSSGTAKTVDWTTANLFALSVTANCTISFSGAAVGQQIVLELSASSPFTITWPGGVRWEDGVAPVLTGGNKTDLFGFYYNGTGYFGKVIGQGY